MSLHVVEDNTDPIIEALGTAMAAALEEVGLACEEYAADLAPKRTGRLANSITHAIDAGEKVAVIGTNTEYAIYVHEGVRGRPGQPFLRNAATQHVDTYAQIFEKHLRGS